MDTKKNQNGSKKVKNDFLRGPNMRKLHHLTYFIDRNKILKILVTPIFDGYQKKFKMALKRPKMTFLKNPKKIFFSTDQKFPKRQKPQISKIGLKLLFFKGFSSFFLFTCP